MPPIQTILVIFLKDSKWFTWLVALVYLDASPPSSYSQNGLIKNASKCERVNKQDVFIYPFFKII